MARTCVRELRDGETVQEVFLLADKQLRANRNADLYLLASLRDRTGIMSGLMWNVSEERLQHLAPGDMVLVKGKVQLYQGNLQMILTRIEPAAAGSFDPEDFILQPAANVEPLLARLNELMQSISCPRLKALSEAFLQDQDLVDALCAAPAGVKAHHAYHGGLLEHIVSMAEVADRMCQHYTQLSRDLLLIGVLLHDLGKVRELAWEPGLTYTDEGQLVGHMTIAVEMLNEKLALVNDRLHGNGVSAEDVLRIKHMIISHHGTLEFGSARVPMTLEAIVLHHIDNLDAKLHEFTRAIDDDPNTESAWTPYSPRLERRLFKGQSED